MKLHSKKVMAKVNERRKGLFWSLACFLFALSTLYVYYVNTAALHGVRWETLSKASAAAEAAISSLEATYLTEKRGVTLSLASKLGFQDAGKVVFLTPNRDKVSLVQE